MPDLNRRRFLSLAGTAVAGAANALAATKERAVPAVQPNLLVILVDDLGYGDLACYGAPDLKTPHLDRLAADGIKFTNAYANCPVCSPTRAALLTGRYQELVGVPGVIRTHLGNSWGHLTPDAVLLPSVLKKAGYASAIVGKWHLGLQSPNTPTERGFDFFHGFLGDMMDDYYSHRRHGINYMMRNTTSIDPKGHATDLFSQWAADWLTQQKAGSPFFLYLPYNAPHGPIQPPKEWLERVQAREPQLKPKRAKIVALIEHMDHGIGQVLAALEDAGHADNTLVVFVSDNGGDLPAGAFNGPVRSGKGTMYEGGLRVPMIARWPGHIAKGTATGRIALTMDIFATCCEAAGAKVGHEIDGVSFLRTLLGQKQPAPERDLFFGRREGGRFFNGGTIECVRRGDWKLLRSKPGGPLELYNLAADPLEKRDLAKDKPEKARELAQALNDQLARYARVPWKPPGKK
ncbi:MAG: sulfatase [Candidatus Brocadiae bacterium]|nr:sulfatase [Candidatus Brocadiia bacterium]